MNLYKILIGLFLFVYPSFCLGQKIIYDIYSNSYDSLYMECLRSSISYNLSSIVDIEETFPKNYLVVKKDYLSNSDTTILGVKIKFLTYEELYSNLKKGEELYYYLISPLLFDKKDFKIVIYRYNLLKKSRKKIFQTFVSWGVYSVKYNCSGNKYDIDKIYEGSATFK